MRRPCRDMEGGGECLRGTLFLSELTLPVNSTSKSYCPNFARTFPGLGKLSKLSFSRARGPHVFCPLMGMAPPGVHGGAFPK